jgi:hypothetical protein
MRKLNMLASAALVFMCTIVRAEPESNCDYGVRYDAKQPPSAVIAPGGDGQSAMFEWGTDADRLADGVWIWNYITNKGLLV